MEAGPVRGERRWIDLALAGLAGCFGQERATPEMNALQIRVKELGLAGGLSRELLRAANGGGRADQPLHTLAQRMGLTDLERLTIAFLLALDEEPLLVRVLAQIQHPATSVRPMLSVLGEAFRGIIGPEGSIHDLLGGAAVASGLLQVLDERAPLGTRTLALPVPLSLALRRLDARWPAALPRGEIALPLPPSIREEAVRQARALGDLGRSLVIRGRALVEARGAAAAVAVAHGGEPLFLDGAADHSGLVPWLLLHAQVPVFCWDLGPGERVRLPALVGYKGPILAVIGHDGAVSADSTGPEWVLTVPSPSEREALWLAALGPHSGELAVELAHSHRHGPGRIAALGRLACHRARVDGRAVTRADVEAVAWTDDQGLLRLAQPLYDRVPDEALVAGSALRRDLEQLVLRCRYRGELSEGLGASVRARHRPGACALFVGQSGTGKTLAAGWLATRLGLPIYRVDLAAVTSKYIGETEKNLAQLLAAAEHAGIVLLFDEADSMFGKRTDITTSTDRFANSQTNYLLQRIEMFDGVAILTSNNRQRLDAAFMRRLDGILEFPVPDQQERLALWRSHLGEGHRLTRGDLEELAALATEFTGGHIRNVVLTAALLARGAGRPITRADVLAGLAGEYRKLGRPRPGELKGER